MNNSWKQILHFQKINSGTEDRSRGSPKRRSRVTVWLFSSSLVTCDNCSLIQQTGLSQGIASSRVPTSNGGVGAAQEDSIKFQGRPIRPIHWLKKFPLCPSNQSLFQRIGLKLSLLFMSGDILRDKVRSIVRSHRMHSTWVCIVLSLLRRLSLPTLPLIERSMIEFALKCNL